MKDDGVTPLINELIKDRQSLCWRNFALVLFSVLVVPNLFLWGLASFYSLNRPVINVDYAFLVLFFILARKPISCIAFFVVYFFDLLGLVGQIFPVLKLSGTFYLFKYIF